MNLKKKQKFVSFNELQKKRLSNITQETTLTSHGFHLVDPSPWPILAGICALSITLGGVLFMHSYARESSVFILGFLILLSIMAI